MTYLGVLAGSSRKLDEERAVKFIGNVSLQKLAAHVRVKPLEVVPDYSLPHLSPRPGFFLKLG
jgi:hypothetical protein